jgi:hypothetical protein
MSTKYIPQPYDADLAAIADLTTTSFGRSLLTQSDSSQVRTLLGLATTDSPTFAGVTLGTSGTLVGGTNRIEQRNGTNAQILEIAKTWTSSTNFEELTLDAASDAANYRIGSRIGSAGGTTRGLQLGSYNAAGAWTSWLGVDASGLAASNVYGTGSPNGGVSLRTTAASSNYVEAIGSSLFVVNANNITAAINRSSTKSIATTSDGFFAFGPSSTNANGFGAVATLSQSSGIIFASGGFGLTPPSSVTISTNGQFTFETPSNTEGNLVYRGNDGTTRRFRFPIGVYTLPLTDGTNGQVLQTNGTGVVSFGSVQKTITSGTAAPSGGVDGDIYLQYT